MEILDALDSLEDGIEKCVSVPFSNKTLIDKEEILELVKDVRLRLPDDIKQAKWIKQEESRIIEQANEEAERIINKARNEISSLVDEHEITKKAYTQANEIIETAQKSSREIKSGTKQYADQVLLKVEDILKDTLDVLKTNRDELKDTAASN
jgi:vacuolar-type H+-ATPase subunit H